MIKQQILENLKRVIHDLGYTLTDIVCDIPKNSQFGDYTTNLPLQLAKLEGKNGKQSPIDIANKIINNLGDLSYISKIEVAGPGFLNFYIKPEFLSENLKEILKKGDNFGKSENNKGKKARVEFVSANPTGPLHIGNARGGPLGDVVANVLASQGYQVLREYIHNDVGEQVKDKLEIQEGFIKSMPAAVINSTYIPSFCLPRSCALKLKRAIIAALRTGICPPVKIV